MSTCMEVSNLTKSFKGRRVVNGLSFEVKKLEVFGLLGHNGAGKSTTIETVLGLKKPDSGNVKILVADLIHSSGPIPGARKLKNLGGLEVWTFI